MNSSNTDGIIRELLAKTGKVCFVYDVDAHALRYLNRMFDAVWKRTGDGVMENPASVLESVHPDDRKSVLQKYDELMRGVPVQEAEFRIILPDRSARWIRLSPQLLPDEQGRKVIAGMAEDITASRDNAENLHKFASKKNSVLEILSHDLAGSLGIIQSLAGYLSETVKGYENAEANNLIRIIQESSSRSLHLIRDFVQQEFLESVNTDLVKKRVNLIVKLQEVVEQYQDGEIFTQKKIRLMSTGNPVFVHIDGSKFMQVIDNLISNSIKFTYDGGFISVEVEEKDKTVLIMVKDNGIGIPKMYHEELFERFTRARREGLKGEPSTGLGMSIIKTVVEWHNGAIWFESEPEVGTTFYIEIPKD